MPGAFAGGGKEPLGGYMAWPPERPRMGERVWLVERSYGDKGLVTLIYATPDGERHVRLQRSATMLRSTDVTAAREAEPDRLVPVTDPDVRDRYASEAARMRDRHAPDDPV